MRQCRCCVKKNITDIHGLHDDVVYVNTLGSIEYASIGSDNGFSPFGARSLSEQMEAYYLIMNWNIGNKFQWNSNPNTTIFIQENTILKCHL